MGDYVKDYKSVRNIEKGNPTNENEEGKRRVLAWKLKFVLLLTLQFAVVGGLPWIVDKLGDFNEYLAKDSSVPDTTTPQYADSWGIKYIKKDGSGILVDGKRLGGKMFLPDVVRMLDESCKIETIGERAFECSYLASVKLQKYLRTIDDYAFLNCQRLTEVYIPENVEYIGYLAFHGCDALTTLYCVGSKPCNIERYTFDKRHYKDVTVYVPQGSLEAYNQTYGWKKFENIEEYVPEEWADSRTLTITRKRTLDRN